MCNGNFFNSLRNSDLLRVDGVLNVFRRLDVELEGEEDQSVLVLVEEHENCREHWLSWEEGEWLDCESGNVVEVSEV